MDNNMKRNNIGLKAITPTKLRCLSSGPKRKI